MHKRHEAPKLEISFNFLEEFDRAEEANTSFATAQAFRSQ